MNCMNDLPALIRNARERRGITNQAALGELIGRDQSFVSRLERGLMKELPTPETLRAIGDALGLTMPEMLEAAGYVDPAPPSDVITIPASDPRAALLAALADATDRDVLKATLLIEVLVDYAKPAPAVVRSDGEPIGNNRNPTSA